MKPSDMIPELEQKAFSLILSQNYEKALSIFENSKLETISKIGIALLKLSQRDINEAIAILETLDDNLNPHETGLVLIIKGEIEQNLGNYSNAEAIFKETLNSYKNNKYLEAMALLKLSTLYQQFVQIENGHSFAQKSIEIIEELLKDDLTIYRRDLYENIKAQAELTLANYYLIARGKINEAYLYSAKALAQFTNINNKLGMSSCWNNLAKILISKQYHDAAIEYTLSSYNVRMELKDETLMTESLVSIAELYEYSNPAESFSYYSQALELSIKNNNIYYQIVSNIGLSTIALKMGDMSFAEKSIEQAEEFERILGVKTKISKTNLIFLNKGILYMQQEKWDEAKTCLMKAISLAEKENLADGYIQAIINLAELYILQNDLESAKELLYSINYPKFTQIEDSMSALLCMQRAKLSKAEMNHGQALLLIEKAINLFSATRSPENIICSKIESLEIKLEISHIKLDFKNIAELLNELDEVILDAKAIKLLPLTLKLLLLKTKELAFQLRLNEAKETLNKANKLLSEKKQSKLILRQYTETKKRLDEIEKYSKEFKNVDESYTSKIKHKIVLEKQKGEDKQSKLDNDDIYFIVITIGQHGAKVIVSEELPFDRATSSLLMSTLGVFYGTAIGQGNRRNEGLYGPLPVADFESFSALIYSRTFNDETQDDPREGGKTYTMVIMLYKNNKQRLFYKRDSIQDFYESELKREINIVSDFTEDFIKSFKSKFIKFIINLTK